MTNILKFPRAPIGPDEKSWREILRTVRAEYGGDASRDAQLAHRLAAVHRKLDDLPLPTQTLHWPQEHSVPKATYDYIQGEVRRLLEAQVKAAAYSSHFVSTAAVLNAILTLTGAEIAEDGPMDRPDGPLVPPDS